MGVTLNSLGVFQKNNQFNQSKLLCLQYEKLPLSANGA